MERNLRVFECVRLAMEGSCITANDTIFRSPCQIFRIDFSKSEVHEQHALRSMIYGYRVCSSELL
jgi:hypothetical protein